MPPRDDYSYEFLTQRSTGSVSGGHRHKVVVVPYGRFEISVCLTEDNRFVGVTEIRVKKDFRNIDQRIANSGYFDVEQFYQD
jgi:hypothetical protein